jgi:hypothetical protein
MCLLRLLSLEPDYTTVVQGQCLKCLRMVASWPPLHDDIRFLKCAIMDHTGSESKRFVAKRSGSSLHGVRDAVPD